LNAELGTGIIVPVEWERHLSEELYLRHGERRARCSNERDLDLRMNGESNMSRKEDFDEVGV
jgi:hypothetical protein